MIHADSQGRFDERCSSEPCRSRVEADGGDPSLDELLEALSTRRRRYLMYALASAGTWTELPVVTERIVAWERDVSVSEVDESSEYYEDVLRDLHHVHVPKLANIGLIEWDPHLGDIRCGGSFSPSLEDLLIACTRFDPIEKSLEE